MKINVQYTTVIVKNLEESVRFYKECLGFKEGYHCELPMGGAITIMQSVDGASVELIENEKFDVGMYSIGTDVDNLDEALEVLADKGVKNIAMYDVSVTDPSVIVSESFRCSHLVFAAPSYNGGIFTKMETVLSELKAHSLQNRTVAIMENGTWAPVAGRQMREIFASMKNIELLEEGVTIRSAVKEAQEASLEALAEKIASSLQ